MTHTDRSPLGVHDTDAAMLVCQHDGRVTDLARGVTRRSRVVRFMFPRLLAAVDGEVNVSTLNVLSACICSCGISVGLPEITVLNKLIFVLKYILYSSNKLKSYVLCIANALSYYHFSLSHVNVVSCVKVYIVEFTQRRRRRKSIIFLKQDSAFGHECNGRY